MSRPLTQTKRFKALLIGAKFVAAGVILYLLHHYNIINLNDVSLSFLGSFYGLVALLAIVGAIFFAAAKWFLLLKAMGLRPDFIWCLKQTFISTFGNLVLPGSVGGEAYKTYQTLRFFKNRRLSSTSSILIDKIIGLFGMTCIGVSAFALIGQESSNISSGLWTLLIGIGIPLLLGILFGSTILRLLLPLTHKLPKLHAALKQMVRVLYLLRRRPIAMLNILLASLCVHVCFVCAASLICFSLGLSDAGLFEITFATTVSNLANLLSLTPGGIGIGEGVFATTISWISDTQNMAAYGTAFLTYRMALIVASAPGIFLFLGIRSK